MDKPKKPRWAFPRWTPLLHVVLEVPFVTLRTGLLYYAYEARTFSVVRISWRVWKWSGDFDLYWQEGR